MSYTDQRTRPCRDRHGRPATLVRRGLLVTGLAVVMASPASPAAAATWTVVPSPSPGTVASALQDVAVISASNTWAVGYTYDSNLAAYRTLVLHHNGTSWARVTSPNASATGYSQLNKVDASAAGNVWAIGYDTQAGTLVERFDGTSWRLMPRPTAGTVRGLDAVSPTDVWGVGYSGSATFVTHWNGSSWITIPSLPPGAGRHLMVFEAVAARASNDVWAVGWDRDYNVANRPVSSLVAHWNGTAWTRVPSPNPATRNTLTDVVALAADDVWAVGVAQTISSGITPRSLMMHWNGQTWTTVATPQAEPGATDQLQSVAAVSPTSVWAVGYYNSPTSGTYEPLLLHATGTSAVVNPSPDVGVPASLGGVSATSTGTVWAVGYTAPPGEGNRTLTMRTTGG